MRLTYESADGSIAIVTAAPKSDLEHVLGPLTDEQYRAHILERSVPRDAKNIRERSDDWEPSADRTFRDAWVGKNGDIEIDIPRAREVQRNRIRTARKPLLNALDIETWNAIEGMDHARLADISARKQALRDAPADPRIDAAETPEELAAIWPDGLTHG